MRVASNRVFGILVLSFLESCAPKLVKPALKPEEIPDFAFKNLRRQRSFAFDYRLEQEEPVKVKQNASGIYILPDQEEIKGCWTYRDGPSLPFHLIGYGDKEYEKREEGWQAHSRGEQTDVLIQVERARALAKFKLVKEEPDWEFEFEPNVPFLDPTFKKEMKGVLVVTKNYLPRRITAWDEEKTVFWQVGFKDYNRPGRIDLPFVKRLRVLLALETDSDLLDRLRLRFLNYGLGAKFSTKGPHIELVLTEEIKEELLNNLLNEGVVRLVKVRWLEEGGGTVTSFGGRPVAIEDTLLNNQDLAGARVGFDPLGRAVLEIFLNPSGVEKFLNFTRTNLGQYYGIVVDNKIWAINYIDKIHSSNIISLTELPTYKDALMIQAIINSGPLSSRAKVIEIEKEE